MALGHLTMRRPATRAGLSLARTPGWLTWGLMIGLVQVFAIATVAPLGVSTAYPQLVGFVGDTLFPGFAASQPYLKDVVGASIGWEVMLVFGVLAGAFVAAVTTRRGQTAGSVAVAPVAVVGFSGRRTLRLARAFLGGFLFIFGARLAGGCTTGHILSGTAQLALSGLVFAAATFASGILVARLLFREPGDAR
jgi:uncharacterized protein